jgi:hypothetical protein
VLATFFDLSDFAAGVEHAAGALKATRKEDIRLVHNLIRAVQADAFTCVHDFYSKSDFVRRTFVRTLRV